MERIFRWWVCVHPGDTILIRYAGVRHWGALRWTIAILSSVYAAVFIYMLIAKPGTEKFYTGFFNIYEFVPPLFGAICGIWLACRWKHGARSQQIGWLLIGLGCLSFAIGQATYTYLETFKGIDVPTPSWADAGYAGSYPFLVVGMMLFLHSAPKAGRGRLLMDSAIAAAALGAVSWYFMIDKVWAQSVADNKATLLGRVLAVGYPLGDIVILFLALVAFYIHTRDRAGQKSMALLGVGIILVAFSDSVYTYLNMLGTYKTGSWNDWGWPFGWLFISFACLNRLWNKPSVEAEEVVREKRAAKGWVIALRAFAPYIAAGTAVTITLGHDYYKDHKFDSAHNEIILLGALIVIRQLFMLVENVGLTRRIAAVNDDLERRVEERTRQIACIQALTRAVNTTLDIDLVANEGGEHCRGLLDADAVAIWLWKDPSDRKGPMALRSSIGFDEHADFLASLSSKINFVGEGALGINEVLSDGVQASCLLIKLCWHSEPLGAVVAIRFDRAFESSEHELIEVVGVELGSAFHNAIQHAVAVEAADRDPVTRLFNHRAFHQRFRSVLKRAAQSESTVSVMMLDLNNFKLFNDTYGHMAGDQVLKTVSKTLLSCLPKDALCARYGGDEFVVSLPDADGEGAERVITQLSTKLADLGYTQTGEDRNIPITVSAGIATYPSDAESHHDLLSIADQNLYSAKALETGIVRSNEQQRENRALRAEGSFEVLDALVTAVDNKDRYTRKHSEDVTEYALWIAEELGLSQDTMRIIRTSGLLHDVGKIGVPSEILRKPDRLTPEEYEIIKRHPRLGELIVAAIPGMEPIIEGVRSHHERWDGQGYPDQLAGEDIPFLGRLLGVADAFSAMTTDRPYRKGMNWDVALKQIEDNMGTQFDPTLAEVFLRAVARRRDADLQELAVDAA